MHCKYGLKGREAAPDCQELHITSVPVTELQRFGAGVDGSLPLVLRQQQVHQLAAVRRLLQLLLCHGGSETAPNDMSFSKAFGRKTLSTWSPRPTVADTVLVAIGFRGTRG